jgi:hypothetical protein
MFDDNSQPPKIRVTQYDDRPTRPLTEGLRSRPPVVNISRRWWVVALVIAALIIAAGALFMYFRAQQQLNTVKKDLENVQTDPAAKTREANKQLIEQVGKLIVLPQGEEPTIATVSDLSKLQGQPFFAKAQVGDKVLIYQVAKKAILFRPSENKIIELAPLNNNGQAGTPTTSASPAESPPTNTPAPAQ